MKRLRARHWLAVTLAITLIVVASSTEASDVVTEGEFIVAGVRGAGRLPPDAAFAFADQTEDDVADTDLVGPRTETDAERFGSNADATSEPPPTVVAPVLSPLTGLPARPGTAERSALVIKIDNHPRARPQTALDQADIVFDMRAEVVNRFAAVFQSQVPDLVGPVRSSRTSDFDILRGFDTPIYGSSGGNRNVLAGLRSLPIVALTNQTRNEYVRDRSRSAPHNLYIDANILYDLAPDDLPTPEPWFSYRSEDEDLPASAYEAVGPVEIDFTGSSTVTHRWDADRLGWLRTQDGEPHLTAAGDQLAPENVVIMVTSYSTSAADPISPEVRSTGSGRLFVLTNGQIITGDWERAEPTDKPLLLDESGQIIKLTPGRTWVLLPEPGQVTLPEPSRGRESGVDGLWSAGATGENVGRGQQPQT